MLTGILIIAIVAFLGVLSHRRSRLEDRIYRNVPLSEWVIVLIVPIALYIGWFVVVKSIVERPAVSKFPLDDFDILAVAILFMIYGFVGNGFHFTGKILWRYLSKNSMAYRVNEMFHGKLSHYLVFLNFIFIIFLMAVMEINHPLAFYADGNYLKLTVLSGLLFGYAGSKAVFYTNEWFGGYNKPLFFIAAALFILLINIEKFYRMNYSYYPVNLFVASLLLSGVSSFVIRQFMIFAKLGQKRKLRFVAKIFSA